MIDQSRLKRAATALAVLALSACASTSTLEPGPSAAQRAAKIQRAGARPGYVPACPCFYVANQGGGISIFPVSANGNFNPGANVIFGANTGLLDPRDVAVGATGIIYVANSNFGGTDRVTVYAAGSSGNVTPIQTISGSATLLSDILGIAVDGAGNIYVSNGAANGSGAESVDVFAANANGNVAPLRTISGALTGIDHPYGVAVDPTGNLYVVNNVGETVTVFAPGANGNVAPIQTIGGSHTGFANGPIGIAWGHGPPLAGRIYVTESNGEVAIFHANANGNIAPVKTISGALTHLNQPWAVALGPSGGIFVANLGAVSTGIWAVTKYSPFGFLAAGNNNVAPVHTIVGPNTGFWLPDGLAVH